MGTLFSTLVMLVTVVAAFSIGVAAARKLVSGVLHLMMQGRLKQRPAEAKALTPVETR